ncbi:hypothetical protein LEL_10692 [Akanthomyces lecanii RCEF 1005]|uniref:Uncharacterized protein n=1 Tax=Akanthomyces lecanii RCEF 1005 TaxID=1081108 RepID=A0A167W1R1_CORDF|nr:hypothetical protein LEL_10692 [Akanthomyces lecanii RCEF 1005]
MQDAENYTSGEVTAFLDMYMKTFSSAFEDFRSSPLELKECEEVIAGYIAEIEEAQATWEEHRNLSFAQGQTQIAVGIILGLIGSRCDIRTNLLAVVDTDKETATRMAARNGIGPVQGLTSASSVQHGS